MGTFLLYGANGYTGTLIAREAAARGLRPVLAGRDAGAVAALAAELRLEHRTFALDIPSAIDENLRGVSAVLHCAGPFAHTFQAMADACVRTGCHYLDITGEALVFETLAGRGAEAKAAHIMLLPGVGFDIVPSDCLAAHLKRRLPTATHLALALQSFAGTSRGTARTIAENMAKGGLVRRNGVLQRVPAAWKTRAIDFGNGARKAFTIPWGDVAAAFYSTGIPNIEVYMEAPWALRVGARLSRYLGWLLGSDLIQGMMKNRIAAGPPGPSAEQRARGRSILWGEVTDDQGHRAVSRLHGPDGYTLTVHAALAVVERVLAGQPPPGYQTPSTAYGADFVLALKGVTREDV